MTEPAAGTLASLRGPIEGEVLADARGDGRPRIPGNADPLRFGVSQGLEPRILGLIRGKRTDHDFVPTGLQILGNA